MSRNSEQSWNRLAISSNELVARTRSVPTKISRMIIPMDHWSQKSLSWQRWLNSGMNLAEYGAFLKNRFLSSAVVKHVALMSLSIKFSRLWLSLTDVGSIPLTATEALLSYWKALKSSKMILRPCTCMSYLLPISSLKGRGWWVSSRVTCMFCLENPTNYGRKRYDFFLKSWVKKIA